MTWQKQISDAQDLLRSWIFMFGRSSFKTVMLIMTIGILAAMTACTPAEPQTVEVTRVVENTVVVTQVVEVEKIITTTPEPTLVPVMVELPTSQPTLSTPEALPTTAAPLDQPVAAGTTALPAGFYAWSLPLNMVEGDSLAQTGDMTPGAKPVFMENGSPALYIEVQHITFVYTFDRPIQPGTKVVFHDVNDSPFYSVELIPTAQNPNKAYAIATHGSVINPQVWSLTYRVSVEDPGGKEVRSDNVIFKRSWVPALCYGGVYPDAVTGACPYLGEAHPWDPWYGYKPDGGVYEGWGTPGAVTSNPYAEQ